MEQSCRVALVSKLRPEEGMVGGVLRPVSCLVLSALLSESPFLKSLGTEMCGSSSGSSMGAILQLLERLGLVIIFWNSCFDMYSLLFEQLSMMFYISNRPSSAPALLDADRRWTGFIRFPCSLGTNTWNN